MNKSNVIIEVADILEYAAIIVAIVLLLTIVVYFSAWAVWGATNGVLVGGTHLYNFIVGG